MSGGVLDFSLPKPDWLNFGRSAEFDHELTIAAVLSLPSGYLQFYTGNRLERTSGICWGTAGCYRVDITVPCPTVQIIVREISVADQAGQPISSAVTTPWVAGQILQTRAGIPWITAQPLLRPNAITWSSGQLACSADHLSWTQGQPTQIDRALVFAAAQPLDRGVSLRAASALPIIEQARIIWDSGVAQARLTTLRYDQAIPPPHGWRIVPYVPPESGKHEGRLNFVCPAPHYLNFGLQCLGSALLYPAIRRSYRVLNSASLIRVSDSADIPCSSIKIGLDWASWCWTLSATLIGSAAHDLVPAYPGKVRATLNGFVWDFIVDDLRYSRSFGAFSATLTGRSFAAVMAEPYAATRSYAEANLSTAQQLAVQELISGWQLDWAATLTDWTVPAGTYQYQNLTPLASILRIVKATGGRVYADAVDNTLHVLPKWPIAPWDWATAVPDQSLPSSYTLTEQRNAATGAEYDCIVVSGGVNNGICVLATRDGMPGTYPANAVIDSLITDLAPATARATQEIADQWPMKHYELSLPLQATPAGAGLLLPGTIFDFVDGEEGWRGLVTGVSLTAGRTSIMQDLEVVAP